MKPQAQPQERRVNLPQFYREASIVPASVNAEQRTFDIIWTAGAEVPRIDWYTGERYIEVLEVSARAVRLDRLKSGRAPILDTHSRWSLENVIGKVQGDSVRLEGGKGYASALLSGRETIAPLINDIREGIIANVSPGYITHAYREEMREGKMYRIATDWEPTEISFVPVGADADAGRRAMGDAERFPCLITRAAVPADDAAAATRARMRLRQSSL